MGEEESSSSPHPRRRRRRNGGRVRQTQSIRPGDSENARARHSTRRANLGGMVCYNFYIFNRDGVCLYYSEWSRPKHVKDGAGTLVDDAKMMFGLLFSLKNVCM